jgi:HAD superfamily hydrolase (TIGR01509 family)
MITQMKHIEAVIFDCDGIIVDSAQLQAQAEQATAAPFAEQHGLNYDPETIDWSGMEGWARKKIAASIYGIPVESEEADKFRVAVIEKTVEIACDDNLSLIPGIEAFTDYLILRGLKLGVATSSNRKIYSRYCELHQIDFAPPGNIVTYGEAKENKPKPDPFIEIMRRMNVASERTLVIEDSGSGITAGRRAGAIVLAIATTKSTEYLHTKTGAHIVTEDFKKAAHELQPLMS